MLSETQRRQRTLDTGRPKDSGSNLRYDARELAVSQYQVGELRTRGPGSANLASPDFQVAYKLPRSTHLHLEQQRTR